MDTVTSLVGNKIFSSLYDPSADKLAAQFRESVNKNFGSLENVVAKAKDTTNVLKTIPGVSDSTKQSLEALVKQAEDFSKGAINLSPNTIAAKKDEIDLKIKELVAQAKGESREKKEEEEKKKKEALKEKIENQSFSFSRLVQRSWDSSKMYLLYIGILVLALWGGSISSNANVKKPLLMRIYYFLYGALLFPVSFAFAIYRYTTGNSGPYYAVLAPLIEAPVSNDFIAVIMAPFIYNNPTKMTTVADFVPAAPVPVPTGLTGTSV